jgi:hypothetical protein
MNQGRYLQLAAGFLTLLTINASGAVLYVDVNSTSPTPLYTNWATAAVTIQNAIDAAVAGDQILVTNGVYQTGGRAVYGTMTNRVAVDKPVTVQSVNGPAVTMIQGYQLPGTTNGDGAIRCVYLTNSASLSGFTLTNGATRSQSDVFRERSGGGMWCESAAVAVSNCVVVGNSADWDGGGAYYGTLNNCTLTGNSASNGGGGVAFGTLNNCVVYFNTNASGANYYSSTLSYCCTTPAPGGAGNITNAPVFVDLAGGNLRLQSNSPCINSGYNTYVTNSIDLDGNPRIVGGTVDMGAYEFQSPTSVISYAWLQQYGLLTDGSADYTDADSDGLNNWQEWIAGTVPTNALSVLRLLNPSNNVSGISVSWQSVSGQKYWLERATNLGIQPPFSLLKSNLTGQAGTTSYTDTNAVGNGPFFYRVGVQQ